MNYDNFGGTGTDWKIKYDTLLQNTNRVRDDAQAILELFGARKKADGSFNIDFAKFVDNLGAEGALQVRAIIDEKYSISGAPGKKPRVKVKAA